MTEETRPFRSLKVGLLIFSVWLQML